MLWLTLVCLLAAGLWGAYWFFFERGFETTDNAYVGGNLVQITPLVPGTVVAIAADETDFVRAGQPLVQLDATDARLALEQAQTQLAQAVREVRTLFATGSALKAAIAQREAEVARAQGGVARTSEDLQRRQPLAQSGAVSQEEVGHAARALNDARNVLAAAQAAVGSAREQLAANQAQIAGTRLETHPNVLRAAARVREAHLALARAVLPAPVDGYVARRSVQLGMRVQPGTPLMTIVPLSQVWVDANFKEVQLRDMRLGQAVTLFADLYGSRVEYRGRIEGMGVGTGAAFALLPAQNATGNWIKVVQRVPVRIALDPAQLAEHPLRVGLSMHARVDVSDRSGLMLADAPPVQAPARTDAFALPTQEVDALIARIIAENAGTPAPAAAAAQAHGSGPRSARTRTASASAALRRR
ncbi:MAG TPA: efflux RND transporter periplasmic adaptor subunit [Rubrivivax sp.]|nr:efflux RND transporter periplasmic adaptor subunit [Rubrivivax sp.]